MNPHTRLKLSAVMILLSVFFAVLVAQNPQVASAVAAGYCGLILTAIFLSNVWKKP